MGRVAESSGGGNALLCIMHRAPPTHFPVLCAHLPIPRGVGASTGDHDLLSRLQHRHALFISWSQVLRQRLRVTNYSNTSRVRAFQCNKSCVSRSRIPIPVDSQDVRKKKTLLARSYLKLNEFHAEGGF